MFRHRKFYKTLSPMLTSMGDEEKKDDSVLSDEQNLHDYHKEKFEELKDGEYVHEDVAYTYHRWNHGFFVITADHSKAFGMVEGINGPRAIMYEAKEVEQEGEDADPEVYVKESSSVEMMVDDVVESKLKGLINSAPNPIHAKRSKDNDNEEEEGGGGKHSPDYFG